MAASPVPMRMCVVCKRRAPKKTLLRYAPAGPDAVLTPDPGQRLQARGLYHCDAPACRQAFARRLEKGQLRVPAARSGHRSRAGRAVDAPPSRARPVF